MSADGSTGTAPPLLRVQGLTRVFGEGPTEVVAVDRVDLTVGRGEIVLVIGPSGSGKTTLLTMIGCLLRPSAGTIEIDGTDVTRLGRRDLARVRRTLVGFVFQTFNLLDALSTQENVELALNIAGVKSVEAQERASRLLAQVDLSARAHFPTRGLSAGERQRVAIARAVANHPPLILADEPTANLDTARGREAMELLRALTLDERAGALVVSHDERLCAIADRVVHLEDGRVTRVETVGSALAGRA